MSSIHLPSIAALLTFAIGAGIAAESHAAPQNPPSAPVTVVNPPSNAIPVTAPQPLSVNGNVTLTGTSNVNVTNANIPVTGSVSASQSGSWNVGQSGTWQVGITGTPTVKIADPIVTIPASDPANSAVQADLLLNDCYSVPSGQRLVVEFVSATALTNAGNVGAAFALNIITSLNGSLHSQTLPMPAQVVPNGGGGNSFLAFSNAIPLRAYADPNTQVCATINYLFGGPVADIRIALTGYLVPHP